MVVRVRWGLVLLETYLVVSDASMAGVEDGILDVRGDQLAHRGRTAAEDGGLVAADGASVITKHDGTGGLVSVGTVTAQLLYEIAAPAYPNPDVVAHFAAPSETLPEFERILKLDEELLRYLVVVNEGDLVTSPVPPEPKRDEESEEEAEEA